MTAVCSGGPSAPKSGVATSIIVDQAYIQSLLPPALAWLYPYLPFMHGLQIGDVASFCAADPPTWTVPSATDIFNFVVGGPLTSVTLVNQFLQDITRAYIWYSICECTTVATPAPPAAPSAPTGLPAINPPTVVTPSPTSACKTSGPATYIHACGGNNPGIGAPVTIEGRYVTGVRVTLLEDNVGGSGFLGSLRLNWFNATANIRVDISPTPLGPGTTLHYFPGAPSGALSAQPSVIGTGVMGVDCADLHATVEFFCNGDQPGGYNAPCCPPDVVATALLHRIDQAVQLIQRQAVPFGFIDGTAHIGLSGSGHLSIADPIIGLRIDLTSIPASYGQSAGDPVEHFDVGFVHLGNGDEWFGSRRLEQSTTLWLPRWAGAADRIGYTLAAGVDADITELLREP